MSIDVWIAFLMCEILWIAEYTHISQMYLRNSDTLQKVDTIWLRQAAKNNSYLT